MKKFITALMIIAAWQVQAQNVGIGTTTPVARLHVTDSNVLFTGPATVPATTTFSPPVQGAGARMMWYPQKAAFRVGYLEDFHSTFWDKDSIGLLSFASGYGTKAKGDYSTAMGAVTTASGIYSTAIGVNTKATGDYSIALGNGANASGFASAAMGFASKASGETSTAMGNFTTAAGPSSTTMGNSTIAKAINSLAVGAYNDNTDNPNNEISSPLDRIFQIGNGTNSLTSNALTVLRNGNMGIGNMNSPNAALQFANVANNRRIVLWETANNDHQFYGFGINGFTLRYQTPSLTDDHVFYSGTNSSSSKELMRIKGNGNVGIGTTTPAARLHVADSSVVFTGATVLPTTPANTPVIGGGYRMMWYADKAAFRAGQAIGDSWDKDNTGNMSFATGVATRATGFTSFAAGNFSYAIGDASTAAGFSVQARALGGTSFGIYNDITDTPSPSTAAAADRIFQIGNGGTNLTRTNALTILRNGNAGIGTTTPANKLSVIGNSDFSGNVGIGTTTPNAPLQISNAAGTLNRKIVLYDANNNDHQFYGLGINAGTLRYQIAETGASHKFFAGTGTGTSNQLLSINGNGSIGVGATGNTGAAGQVLMSTGSGSAPVWEHPISYNQSGVTSDLQLSGSTIYDLPASTITITLSRPSKVILNYKCNTYKICFAGECATQWVLFCDVNGNPFTHYYISASTHNTGLNDDSKSFGPDMLNLPAGTITITFRAQQYFNEPKVNEFVAYYTIIPN